jgi:hypothetical protein
MVVAFRDSLPPADHLTPADAAIVEAGRLLARRLDDAEDDKTIALHMGQFVSILDRLGLHPKARRLMELETPADKGNLFDEARRVLLAAYGPDPLDPQPGVAD